MELEDFNDLYKKIRITLTNNYSADPIVLTIGSSTIATLGNISASVGKAKSGKTFNVLAIASAMLTNSHILKYSANLPTDKRNIIYIDTEQSYYHCQKTIKRIAALSGISDKELENRLHFISLREYNPIERIRIIDYTLQNVNNVGLLIIDGLRDLLFDFNDPSDSSRLINKLMLWSSKYMLHIHTVLHVNKSDGNTRGHLGTELNNKAETIMHINKESNSCVVRPMFTRDQEFSPFAFFINNDGIPILSNNDIKEKKSKRKINFDEITEDQHRQALNEIFGQQTVCGYENIIDSMKKAYSRLGYNWSKNYYKYLNRYLKDKNIVVAEGKGYKVNDNFWDKRQE